MPNFKVKLADVVIGVKAHFSETEAYFQDFLAEELPQEQVEVTQEAIDALQEEAPHFTPEMCERGVLKVLIDRALVDYGVFPLHASAISHAGRGLVFTALSGVGKSTHSASWKHCFGEDIVIINDDRPYIKVTDEGAFIFSHPQSGKARIYSNANSPVRAFCKLVRDDENFIVPISKAAFFPFLVQQTFTQETPELTAKIISLHRKALERAYTFEIHCNANQDAAFEICRQLGEAIEGWKQGEQHG